MKNAFRFLSAAAVAALPFALLGAGSIPQLRIPTNAVLIHNPGNGDYTGFSIVVEPNGAAWSIDGAGRGQGQLQSDVAQALFRDLSAASPLQQLPARSCPNAPGGLTTTSVGANAAIILTWKGQRSPDLSCSDDPRAQKLLFDATTIQRALYVQAYRVRTGIVFGLAGAGSVTGSSPQAPPPPTGSMTTGY